MVEACLECNLSWMPSLSCLYTSLDISMPVDMRPLSFMCKRGPSLIDLRLPDCISSDNFTYNVTQVQVCQRSLTVNIMFTNSMVGPSLTLINHNIREGALAQRNNVYINENCTYIYIYFKKNEVLFNHIC